MVKFVVRVVVEDVDVVKVYVRFGGFIGEILSCQKMILFKVFGSVVDGYWFVFLFVLEQFQIMGGGFYRGGY